MAIDPDSTRQHKHLKRCDASPYGAPCVCPNAPHTLRFLGDNVTLIRSQWQTLREQMHDQAPDARRIDEMLNEPRWLTMTPRMLPGNPGPLTREEMQAMVDEDEFGLLESPAVAGDSSSDGMGTVTWERSATLPSGALLQASDATVAAAYKAASAMLYVEGERIGELYPINGQFAPLVYTEELQSVSSLDAAWRAVVAYMDARPVDAEDSAVSPAQHVAALSMPFHPDRRS